MIGTLKAEDQSQLQLVEREDIDDEEDLFEVIDKRKLHDLRSSSISVHMLQFSISFLALFSIYTNIHGIYTKIPGSMSSFNQAQFYFSPKLNLFPH